MSLKVVVNTNHNIVWDKLSPKELYQLSLMEGTEGDEAQRHFHEKIRSCSRRQLEELAEELISVKTMDPGIQYSVGCIDSLVCGLGRVLDPIAGKLSGHYPANRLKRAPLPFDFEEYYDRRGEVYLRARDINQVRVCDGKTLGHVLAAQGHISCLKDFVELGGNLCVRDHAGKLPIDYLPISEDQTRDYYCLGAYLMQRLNKEGAKANLTDEEWGYFEEVSGSLPAETEKLLGDMKWQREHFPPKFPFQMVEDAIQPSLNQNDSAKFNTLANLTRLVQGFGKTWNHLERAIEGRKNGRWDLGAVFVSLHMKRAAIESGVWAISLLASGALDTVEEQQEVEDLKRALGDFLSTLSVEDLLDITNYSVITNARVRRQIFKLVPFQYTDDFSPKPFEHYECEIVNQPILEKAWQSLVLTPEGGWENAAQEKKDKNVVFGSVLAHAIDRLDGEVAEKRDLRQVYSYLCAVRQVTEVIQGHSVSIMFGSSRMSVRKNAMTTTPISGDFEDYFFQKVLKTSDRNVAVDFFATLPLSNGASLKLTRIRFDEERRWMIHPRADQTMEILFDDAQADFAELMEGDLGEEEVWKKLAKVYWNLVQGMPCSRGNASICLALCSFVWRANGVEPPCLKPGIIPDLEVLLAYPCRDSFIPKFKDLFDASVDG